MLKKFSLPLVLLVLAYGLWRSADFVDIAAGVALFIFGMVLLEQGFKTFAGGALEALLQRITDGFGKSLLVGAVSTTLMQSSSLVSLLTISFVSAEMISLAAGIGIIMGANIGTTTGAWLIAGPGLSLDIGSYAMPMLVFGMVFMMQRGRGLRAAGNLLLGVAFLFLGIHYMKLGFAGFQEGVDLSAYAMTGLKGVLLYTLIGMLVTVIMQSSHATLLIVITALSAGQISYENALALAIGANLGSTVTIVLGSLTSNLAGKRLAGSHVLFNVITATVAIAILQPLAELVDMLARLIGLAPDNYLLRLALFHTLFNVLGVLLLAPFVGLLERVLLRYVRSSDKGTEQPLYLNPRALETPATIVNALRLEVLHLFENAYGLLAHGLSLSRKTIDSDEPLHMAVANTRRIIALDVEDAYEGKIKRLHGDIVAFIVAAQSQETTRSVAEQIYLLRQASRAIVEAVRGMKHLHQHLSRYALSPNPVVRARYDQLRLQLAELLRALRKVQHDGPPASGLEPLLQDLRASADFASRCLIDDLDERLVRHEISATVAAAIMNDQADLEAICEALLLASATLFGAPKISDYDNVADPETLEMSVEQ